MAAISRTIRFAVCFPGWRKSDLSGKDGLWYQLRVVQSDLTRAANAAISALYLLEQGHIERPVNGEKKVSTRTLSYQLMSGKWCPLGPAYAPKGRPVGSSVLLGMSGLVFTRISTDLGEIRKGSKSLATFREVPIPITGSGVVVSPDHKITLKIWPGRKNNSLTVQPIGLNHGQREILNRIVSGRYKHGDAKLYRDPRKKKWMLSLSWTGEVMEREGDLVAGIDLGMATTATIAYIRPSGAVTPVRDRVHIPERVHRAWKRADAERRGRLQSNRASFGMREGRGRQRKLRVVRASGDRLGRMIDAVLNQTAAAIVQSVIKRGGQGIVLEDLSWSTDAMMDETEALSVRARARQRRRWLQWHQGTLRQLITQKAEREGLWVREVNPAYTSRTCHACGTVWKAPKDGYGRVSQGVFRCSCGCEEHADRNAAINIARRGLEAQSA